MIDPKKLAWLLAQSVMPEEQKTAWLNLLPLMTEAQVDQLAAILQREHDSYQTVSKDFLHDIERLTQTMAESLDQLAAREREEIEQYVQQRLKANGAS